MTGNESKLSPPSPANAAQQEFSRLRRLRRRAQTTRRMQPGQIRLDGMTIAYTDLMSLYMEYKDIFVQRIYHFESTTMSPRIIDGGGCIGMSALYFKRLYPTARVTIFEPDAQTLEVLSRNIVANHLTNVEVIPAGLAAQAGTASFQPDGSDGGKISETSAGQTTIRTVCLSDYLAEPVDLVKLNIEGQELAVLREVETRGRLSNIKELILEYHGWADGLQALGTILELLDRHGFRYLVHDFDRETNPTSKPPFRLNRPKTWFCLVYARRM